MRQDESGSHRRQVSASFLNGYYHEIYRDGLGNKPLRTLFSGQFLIFNRKNLEGGELVEEFEGQIDDIWGRALACGVITRSKSGFKIRFTKEYDHSRSKPEAAQQPIECVLARKRGGLWEGVSWFNESYSPYVRVFTVVAHFQRHFWFLPSQLYWPKEMRRQDRRHQ